MADEALHAAERLGERVDLGASENLGSQLLASHLHADHPAKARHLLLGEFMLWMRAQAGEDHALRAPPVGQPCGDGATVGVVRPHAQGQRLGSAQCQPRIHGPRHGACGVGNKLDAFSQRILKNDRDAADHITMAVEVLGA